ncbi:alpha-tocopherol transfer protein-like [Sipha flava]|uniref:Alpha-tocopherol transfer protein n=1 Tax=Sipha flava TaxID=143950 RepID=A0A2S2QJ35_9HEMI|nr:alpha-tocopherol transfer protein-like [Sipha flava]
MYSPSTPFNEYLEVEQAKYPELKLDDIEKLKESLADDQTLPPISEKTYLAFLHSCKFDIELAKKTIKKFYRYNFDIPQIFCELDPLSEDIENTYNCLSICQMPTVNTDKSDRVLYIQFRDYNPEMLDFVSAYKYLVMWMQYSLLRHGTCDGIIVVIDAKGLSWRHILKIPISITMQLIKYMEVALPVRLKSIHVLNCGSAIQVVMKMITKIANQELLGKIQLHQVGSNNIFDYVPKKLMPLETGGYGKSHTFYNDELYNNIGDIQDYFLEQNEVLNNQLAYNKQRMVEDNE